MSIGLNLASIIKKTFFNIFRDLQDHHPAPLESQKSANFDQQLVISRKIHKILQNFEKFEKCLEGLDKFL